MLYIYAEFIVFYKISLGDCNTAKGQSKQIAQKNFLKYQSP